MESDAMNEPTREHVARPLTTSARCLYNYPVKEVPHGDRGQASLPKV